MPTGTNRSTAGRAVGDTVEALRTPFLAALGAGDLATKAVVEVVNKARAQVDRSATSVADTDIEALRGKLSSADLRKLVDTEELRRLVDTAELRKLVDDYTKAAVELYRYLAEHGEGALERARSQPQVKRAIEQLEDVVTSAQERVEGAAGDVRERAESLLSNFGTRTRSFGEKGARHAQETTRAVADTASEAGERVARQARSTSRKAANSADAAGEALGKQTKPIKPEPRSKNSTRTTDRQES